jgi:hypothetical protein
MRDGAVNKKQKGGYVIYYLILMIAIVYLFYTKYQEGKTIKLSYLHSSFNGIIKDTVHNKLEHDWPTYIFLDGSTHFSDINEEYIQAIAKVGDSLSKISGNDTIYIFRKKGSIHYIQIYPYR